MYNNNESDEFLIEAVKNGDCEAFGLIIERYKQLVYRLVYRMVHNRDHAEDLVQEIFIKAYRAINGFKKENRFSPWLSRIAINHTLNFIKKERKVNLQPLEEVPNYRADEKNDPVQITHNKILKEKIAEAMAGLPEEYRIILILRVEEELSYKEISQMLGIPRGTVMSRLARARQRLREFFEETRANKI